MRVFDPTSSLLISLFLSPLLFAFIYTYNIYVYIFFIFLFPLDKSICSFHVRQIHKTDGSGLTMMSQEKTIIVSILRESSNTCCLQFVRFISIFYAISLIRSLVSFYYLELMILFDVWYECCSLSLSHTHTYTQYLYIYLRATIAIRYRKKKTIYSSLSKMQYNAHRVHYVIS